MSLNPTILVTGAGGLFAQYFADLMVNKSQVIMSGRRAGEIHCDLTNKSSVESLITKSRPSIVLHAAAMTNVDQCQKNPIEADRANRLATLNLVDSLPSGCKFVYLSTDQVYPNRIGLHIEGDESPINIYGQSKLNGEVEALKYPRSLILRTNFFGPSTVSNRESLSDFIINNLNNKIPITLFRDIKFSPLHMQTIINIMFDMLEKGVYGVYNLGCKNGMTKADFGLKIAEHLGMETNHISIGDSEMIVGRSPRPMDLRLNISKIENILQYSMPSLEEEIQKL